MKLSEMMRKNPLLVVGRVKTLIEKDSDAQIYIFSCVDRFYAGDYGEVPPEDTAANNAELEAGEGRIVARYKSAQGLEEDIYIIAYFSESNAEEDYNYTSIFYVSDY